MSILIVMMLSDIFILILVLVLVERFLFGIFDCLEIGDFVVVGLVGVGFVVVCLVGGLGIFDYVF